MPCLPNIAECVYGNRTPLQLHTISTVTGPTKCAISDTGSLRHGVKDSCPEQQAQLQEQSSRQPHLPTYSYIVANDCWQCSVLRIVLCYMDYTVILNVAVFPNFDAVDITCETFEMSCAASHLSKHQFCTLPQQDSLIKQ